jgi:hypothetical protein
MSKLQPHLYIALLTIAVVLYSVICIAAVFEVHWIAALMLVAATQSFFLKLLKRLWNELILADRQSH